MENIPTSLQVAGFIVLFVVGFGVILAGVDSFRTKIRAQRFADAAAQMAASKAAQNAQPPAVANPPAVNPNQQLAATLRAEREGRLTPERDRVVNQHAWYQLAVTIHKIDVAEAVIHTFDKDLALRQAMPALYVRALQTRLEHQRRKAHIDAMKKSALEVATWLVRSLGAALRPQSSSVKPNQLNLF